MLQLDNTISLKRKSQEVCEKISYKFCEKSKSLIEKLIEKNEEI